MISHVFPRKSNLSTSLKVSEPRNQKLLGFQAVAKFNAFPVLAFLIPLIMRAIPEILMSPFIVGFDTLGYYVPNTLTWLNHGVGVWNFLAVAPFFYALLMGVTYIGVPIVASLKVLSPLLLGFLGIAVYFYANKTLSWSPKKSLLVVLFATLYFVALRVSWDMLRSELGLIFLFATLMLLTKDGSPRRNGVLLSLSMLSVVFANQLVAVVMFFIVLVTITSLSLGRKMVEAVRLLVSSIPAGFLFLLIVYANYLVSPNFSVLNGFLGQNSAGFMALFKFASYPDLLVNTLGFLVFCYLPLLPLVILGVRKLRMNLQLTAWVFWIFVALLPTVISSNVFVGALPYRWILFLTYPLAFFAAEAFANLRLNAYKVGVGLVLATLSVGFMVLPYNFAVPYYSLFILYVPSSMLQNTVPLSDCRDTVNALHWVKDNMHSDARLLVHDAFYGWASLTLNGNQLIPYGYDNPATFAQQLVENGSEYHLYLIWWVNGSGWHGQPTVSSAFGEVYESGKIAVYTYNSNVTVSPSASAVQKDIKS